MSQLREPGPEPLRPFKSFFFFCTGKSCDLLATLLKGALFIFLVASISLVVFSAFTSPTPWFRCPECHYSSQNIYQAPEPSNISGGISERTNISHIAFGIGGSTRTWKDRRHYTELWWQPNSTRGFVWLNEKPDPNSSWPENSPPYRISSDWTRFKYSSSQPAVRIARVVLDTFRIGLPNVRWFVMGDDDTVFFTENLVSVLAKYDHRQMYYIGGNSESVEQDVMHSYGMAFGGGGFAISYPLAEELAKKLDGCLQRYYYFYGSDQRVWACANEIGVSLTKERGFHQIDIRGDPYGLLAAHPLVPLVSLHHLDYVDPLFPNQTQHESLRSLMRAYKLDPARIIQQCFCYYRWYKWSVSISWGYTVQIYPYYLTANDLAMPLQTFQTWRSWSNGPFTFNTRPVKPDPCEQPVIFHLDAVKEVANDETQTTYRKKGTEAEKKCNKYGYTNAASVKKIVVSARKMDPKHLKEAPRRQCCEISSLWHNTLKMTVRDCKPSETVTI